MTMLFVCAFEFGPGPIVWLYMGEIMNDKGLSIGAAANWTLVLIISLFTPTLMNNLGSWGTFLMFGCTNVLGTIFIVLFMRETRGLKDE
jgi:SP family galactose:H+ symporter-like MFS transporter